MKRRKGAAGFDWNGEASPGQGVCGGPRNLPLGVGEVVSVTVLRRFGGAIRSTLELNAGFLCKLTMEIFG